MNILTVPPMVSDSRVMTAGREELSLNRREAIPSVVDQGIRSKVTGKNDVSAFVHFIRKAFYITETS